MAGRLGADFWAGEIARSDLRGGACLASKTDGFLRKAGRMLTTSVKLGVFGPLVYIMESLILAQNERWRRVLSMQVVRQGGATRPRAADW